MATNPEPPASGSEQRSPGLGGVEATQTAEPTVWESLTALCHCDCEGGYIERGLISPTCALHHDVEDALEALGIDPSLPVSTLRERLAAGERVEKAAYYDGPLREYRLGWNQCLSGLRGEQTP